MPKRLAYTDNDIATAELELAANLRRCRDLLARIGPSDRRYHPDSYGARHLRDTGHHLEFGCCSSSRTPSTFSAQLARNYRNAA